MVDHTQLNPLQKEFVSELFNTQVVPHIMPMIIVKKKITPFLRNQRLYLAVKMTAKHASKTDKVLKNKRYIYAIVEIPTNHIERFILIPKFIKFF